MSSNAAVSLSVDAAHEDTWLPVAEVRGLVGPRGRPACKERVLALGIRGEITVRCIAGRFVASRRSVDAYRARAGLESED